MIGSRPEQNKSSVSPTSSPSFPDPIPGLIHFGSVNIFGGASGVGKTTLCVPLALALRDGTPFFGREVHQPTAIYYLAADRDWRTYHAKFSAAGYPDIPHYALPDDPTEIPKNRQPRSQFDLFDRCMKRLAPLPGSFVFVDPIAPTFVRGDQNNPWDASTAMHHFRWVAKAYQITIWGLSNVVKERTDAGFVRARDRISGSGALGAYSDTQWYLINAKAPDRRIFGWAPREEAEVEYVVFFNPATKRYEYDSGPWPVGEALNRSGEIADEVDRPTQVYLLIPPDGITTLDLEEAAKGQLGISRATLYRDVKVLRERQLIHRDAWGHITRRKLS